MPLIQWSDTFETGHADIDKDHQELVGLINGLHVKLQKTKHDHDEIAEFLDRIYSQVSSHFAVEEKIMLEKNFKDFEEHKLDHDLLLEDIQHILEEFDTGGYDNFETQLSKRLSNWFSVHFRTRDAEWHSLEAE